MSTAMAQRNTSIKSPNSRAAPVIAPPSTAEFAEYTATILVELSKSATSAGLPVLAQLMDLARREAQFHIDRRG
jgi:hypothetical protein